MRKILLIILALTLAIPQPVQALRPIATKQDHNLTVIRDKLKRGNIWDLAKEFQDTSMPLFVSEEHVATYGVINDAITNGILTTGSAFVINFDKHKDIKGGARYPDSTNWLGVLLDRGIISGSQWVDAKGSKLEDFAKNEFLKYNSIVVSIDIDYFENIPSEDIDAAMDSIIAFIKRHQSSIKVVTIAKSPLYCRNVNPDILTEKLCQKLNTYLGGHTATSIPYVLDCGLCVIESGFEARIIARPISNPPFHKPSVNELSDISQLTIRELDPSQTLGIAFLFDIALSKNKAGIKEGEQLVEIQRHTHMDNVELYRAPKVDLISFTSKINVRTTYFMLNSPDMNETVGYGYATFYEHWVTFRFQIFEKYEGNNIGKNALSLILKFLYNQHQRRFHKNLGFIVFPAVLPGADSFIAQRFRESGAPQFLMKNGFEPEGDADDFAKCDFVLTLKNSRSGPTPVNFSALTAIEGAA